MSFRAGGRRAAGGRLPHGETARIEEHGRHGRQVDHDPLSPVATGHHRVLVNHEESDLSFAPDSKSYTFSEGGLWRVNAATGHRRRLLPDDRTAAHPLWSPDGKLIAYLSTKDGKGSIPAGEDTNKTSPANEVYTTNPAATATHRITNTDDELRLTWSTDSQTLLWQPDDLSIHATCLPTPAQPTAQDPQSWAIHATTPILTHRC